MTLEQENIKRILEKLSMQEIEKYRKPLRLLADLREQKEVK